MAKYILRRILVDAEQFDSTKPSGAWPIGVQVNGASKTGYSYGTLNTVALGGGNVKIDGFPIAHLEYLVKFSDGTAIAMTKTEFDLNYEAK